MRSEQEMFSLILETARSDDRIIAVILNGSRANPNAPRDPFQDYDIVNVVTELDSFKQTPNWIDIFGDRMILQLPMDMQELHNDSDFVYAYLIQFADGNRIDLTLFQADSIDQMEEDSETVILLDKDNLFPEVPPPSDSGYFPVPPTQKRFFDCCNEFWWVSAYVAKGLWRNEITYAKKILDDNVREQLMKMLTWYIGIHTDFKKAPGKEGKYFQRYLPDQTWTRLLSTYSDADIENTWNALFASVDLFRDIAMEVAVHFKYEYPSGDDQRVSAHLKHVHDLPKDATEIY